MLRTKDIAFICDDNYCMPTSVCIQSIIDSYAMQEELTIHVCTFGLNARNEEKLKSMYSQYVKTVVDVFNVSNYEDKLKAVSQKTHVTPTALIKFELPGYFQDLESILYLDSDIVVKSDISDLLNIDITGCYIGASYDFLLHFNRIRYTLKRSASPDFYFNSGVMLLNLVKMREDNISDKLWEYKIYQAKTKLMDQESLNAVCGLKTMHLPIKWNFNPRFLSNSFIREINKVYGENYHNLDELLEDIRIIHYVGHLDKPWVYKDALMRSFWDKAFNRTGYDQELKLKDAPINEKKGLLAFTEKIKTHGIYGTICYIIYILTTKNRKK